MTAEDVTLLHPLKKRTGRSNIDVHFDGNCLVIGLSGLVSIRTIDAILRKATLCKGKNQYEMTNIILDLSDVYPISPAAAVGLSMSMFHLDVK